MTTENSDCKVKILLVDDRDENLLSLESIIEGADRELIKARSGNEALKLNLTHEFDLILSDVQMPEMDGFEMLEILRSNPAKRNIPFIFLTALSKEEHYIQRGYDEGAVDYLFKPLNIDIVRSKVDIFVELAKQRQRLAAQNAQLKDLYALKNQYMGMLAHDLRNPIGAFNFYCDYLIDEIVKNPTEEEARLLHAMQDSAKQMMQLLNDVLDMAQLDSGTITLNNETVNLISFINSIAEINSVFANKKGIVIKQEIEAPANKQVVFDAPKIRQVLNNLVSNAIKFSNADTSVEIKVAISDRKLFFAIIDNGQGIPAAEIDKLFKSFSATSVKSTAGEKSNGLGLSICAKIVNAYGDKIAVSSEVGKGSTFSFFIPLVYAENTDNFPKEIKATANTTAIPPKLILVADDTQANQIMLKRVLEKDGHSVLLASNGLEVIECVKKNTIDVIFMDVEMPEMNGLEASRILKEEMGHKTLPIIGCTGHSDEMEMLKCHDAGMIHCITKPIDKEKVQMAMMVAFS